jgi:hypothetical protein
MPLFSNSTGIDTRPPDLCPPNRQFSLPSRAFWPPSPEICAHLIIPMDLVTYEMSFRKPLRINRFDASNPRPFSLRVKRFQTPCNQQLIKKEKVSGWGEYPHAQILWDIPQIPNWNIPIWNIPGAENPGASGSAAATLRGATSALGFQRAKRGLAAAHPTRAQTVPCALQHRRCAMKLRTALRSHCAAVVQLNLLDSVRCAGAQIF